MLKKYGKTLLLSSIVILLPIVAGLLLWNWLPDTMNIHWNTAGEADGTAGKAFAVFLGPLFLLAMHWFCVFVTHITNKNNNQTPKAMALTLWIIPVLSNVVMATMYTVALGLDVNMGMLLFMPMGILFAVIGNYMPKFRRNSTMGIKTVWALADDENWNATHRFGGRIWMAGGLLVCVLSCLPWDWGVGLTFVVIFAFAFAPVIYSWQYHKKQVRAGKVSKSAAQNPREAAITKWTLVAVAVIFLVLGIFLCTGQITVAYGDTALTVDATYWDELTIDYTQIDSVEFREQDDPGSRIWGFGSFRLLLGTFENEEFGSYTRYSYTNPKGCIVLTVDGKTLVIADKDTETTHAIYEQIVEKTGQQK